MSHIERETLEMLYRGELPLDRQMEVLEHISNCDYCADAFANVAEELTLMAPPANLKSSILHEANTLPVQLQTRRFVLSKRMQLMLYSMKISAAVMASIILVFTTSYTGTRLDRLSKATDTFTQTINTMTEQLIHREVIHND